MTTPTTQIPVGALYGLPGFTESFEQYENINQFPTTLAAAAQTPFNPPASFQKTDIVKWWEMELSWSAAETFSAGTIAYSPEAPYNLLQNFKLRLQGQYSPVEVESGFDLAFMQMYRPMRGKGQRNMQDLINVGVAPTTFFANPAIPEATNIGTILPSAVTSPYTLTNYPMLLEIPAGIWLDQYWDLALDGSLLPNATGVVAPVSAFVSPQYMGGGERVIVPQFNFAANIAPNFDAGPIAATAALTATVQTGSVITSCRRIGIYSSENPAELPPVFNWQYRRSSKRYPIGAATKIDIPITEYGQLFSTYVRIFDPALGANGVGGYYNVPGSVSKAQLLYGSNLPKFDDDVATMQARFIQQHGFLPPQGTVVWDMLGSSTDDLLANNSRVLNTLTNANTHIHLEMSPAPGAGAYAVVGTELLVPVSTQ
jgi:hypothetical protein